MINLKTLFKATVIGLALSSTILYAGSGHNHSHDDGHGHSAQKKVTKASIKEIAKKEVKRLALDKKIDNSWISIPISKMQKTQYNYNNEWKVSFENSAIKEKKKQTLYIFVTVYGELTGANYTGK